MDKVTKTNCATCASPVLLNQSDEGTCFYTPLYSEEQVRGLVLAARSILNASNRNGGVNINQGNNEVLKSALEPFKHIDNETPPEVK